MQHPKQTIIKKILDSNIRMLNVSLNGLKLVAKSRGIKGCKACLKKDY